jgi:hypothetical protein
VLMAWVVADQQDDVAAIVVHAAPRGATHALCGDLVDSYGESWPFPAQEWADERERCPYCARLLYEG